MQYDIVMRSGRAGEDRPDESWLKSLQTMHDIERHSALSLQCLEMRLTTEQALILL